MPVTPQTAGRVRPGRRPLGVLTGLGVGALATWRVSRLLVAEDGPAQLVVRLRRAVDATPLAGVMDCFACTSIWVGSAVAVALFGGRLPARDVATLGLALSGAALLTEGLLTGRDDQGFVPEPDVDSPLVTVLDEA